MGTLKNKLIIIWSALTHKDLLLLSFPNGIKKGQNRAIIITATNHKEVDDLAGCLYGLMEIFNEREALEEAIKHIEEPKNNLQ